MREKIAFGQQLDACLQFFMKPQIIRTAIALSHQKKVEKGITAFYSYRLLTNNRF